MNVENLEVGRYSQRKKRTKKEKKRQNQGQKWRKGEKGEDHPQVEITVGLGCILSKQSIMQNKSKAGQNPRNISQHLNCRINLHLPRLRRFPSNRVPVLYLFRRGSGGWTRWAETHERFGPTMMESLVPAPVQQRGGNMSAGGVQRVYVSAGEMTDSLGLMETDVEPVGYGLARDHGPQQPACIDTRLICAQIYSRICYPCSACWPQWS